MSCAEEPAGESTWRQDLRSDREKGHFRRELEGLQKSTQRNQSKKDKPGESLEAWKCRASVNKGFLGREWPWLLAVRQEARGSRCCGQYQTCCGLSALVADSPTLV